MAASFRGSPIVGYLRSPHLEDPEVEEVERQIRSYAEGKGLFLETIVRDMGLSAVAAWRPGLEQLIRDLERGRYVGVVLPSLIHLGRPRSAALRNLARLRSTSAWVAFLDEQGVPSDDNEK